MSKRSIIIISVPILVLLLTAAVFILLDRPDTAIEDDLLQADVKEAAPRKDEPEGQALPSMEPANVQAPDENPSESSGNDEDNVVRSEVIRIVNNTPEYDLKASLCSSEEGTEFIRLEFFIDGIGVSKKISGEQLPEIDGIFEKRTGMEGEYEIDSIYLNTVYSKVYFMVKGRNRSGFTETALYSLGLKDGLPEKLYSSVGKFTGLFLSPKSEYIGFSFYDNPAGSIFQENSMLQIIKCASDEFIVKHSRTTGDELPGKIRDSKHIYDYELLSWHSADTVRLKETVRPRKDSGDGVTGGDEGIPGEILYDVGRDVFLDPDGSIRVIDEDAAKNTPKKDNQEAEGESEPLKVLRSFYACLASENDYEKALCLLNDDFKLELNILRQFGSDQLGKKDIDIENASVFSGILKQARLESIAAEETNNDNSTIYVYQRLGMPGSEASMRMPIIVRLVKIDGEWKISAASEADAGNPHFKSVEN